MSTRPHSEAFTFTDQLSAGLQAQVGALLELATEADAVAPVSEHVVLRMRSQTALDGARHILLSLPDFSLPDLTLPDLGPATADSVPNDQVAHAVPLVDPVQGYAYTEDGKSIRDVELVVHPDHRRAGHGRSLLQRAAAGAPAGRVRIWAHGDHPGARALARAAGYQVVRTLLQLRRPLEGPQSFDVPVFAPGITVRSFRPGADDETWLRLNGRAFAHHPEQGRMTLADLTARMAEAWFDPKGFLIAEKGGRMIGFHWTKVHPGGLGEVYVLGVDPDLHGAGLGRALTLAGLRHLADQGLRTVLLYVESDNAPALALYQRLGFGAYSTDVMYANQPKPAGVG